MKEVHQYEYYRARLRRPVIWLLPWRMWMKWVRVARWTPYSRRWLIRRAEEQFWPVECRGAALNPRFEIEGRDGKEGEWEPVSEWRRAELRRAEDIASALKPRGTGEVDFEREKPGRRAGSGMGILVRHIRDEEKLTSYDEVLLALRESGLASVAEALRHWGDEARSKLRELYADSGQAHKKSCPYCERGLPAELEAAVARRK